MLIVNHCDDKIDDDDDANGDHKDGAVDDGSGIYSFFEARL